MDAIDTVGAYNLKKDHFWVQKQRILWKTSESENYKEYKNLQTFSKSITHPLFIIYKS